MPIEIRELVIKASIIEQAGESEGESPSDSVSSNREDIIAECVDQVMEILRNQAER